MAKQIKQQRLPISFHKTFKPERQYITAMLRFAAAGGRGTDQEISAATGIPTGQSSGKVPAIFNYCKGMGLIHEGPTSQPGTKAPELTELGRIVLLEDPYLKEEITQWLVHLNLCHAYRGAEVWYQTFFVCAPRLGSQFTQDQFVRLLELTLEAPMPASKRGPIVGTYTDEAALALCGALHEDHGLIERKSAPLSDENIRGYGAWITSLISDYFPNHNQISVTELDAVAGWRTIPAWGIDETIEVLQLLDVKGILSVDRHMDPWILMPRLSLQHAWNSIFDDMI